MSAFAVVVRVAERLALYPITGELCLLGTSTHAHSCMSRHATEKQKQKKATAGGAATYPRRSLWGRSDFFVFFFSLGRNSSSGEELVFTAASQHVPRTAFPTSRAGSRVFVASSVI